MVFSKTYCPYSAAVKDIFNNNGMEGAYGIFEIDISEDGKDVHKAL